MSSIAAAQRRSKTARAAQRIAKRTANPDGLVVARGLLAECRSLAVALNQGRLLYRIDKFLEETK